MRDDSANHCTTVLPFQSRFATNIQIETVFFKGISNKAVLTFQEEDELQAQEVFAQLHL